MKSKLTTEGNSSYNARRKRVYRKIDFSTEISNDS